MKNIKTFEEFITTEFVNENSRWDLRRTQMHEHGIMASIRLHAFADKFSILRSSLDKETALEQCRAIANEINAIRLLYEVGLYDYEVDHREIKRNPVVSLFKDRYVLLKLKRTHGVFAGLKVTSSGFVETLSIDWLLNRLHEYHMGFAAYQDVKPFLHLTPEQYFAKHATQPLYTHLQK